MNVHAYIYCQLQTCNCNLQAQYHKLNTAEMGNFFLSLYAIISGISTMVTFHHLI